MDILVSSNRRYLHQTGTMLRSVLSSTGEPVEVWLLHGGLAGEDRKRLVSRLPGAKVHFILVDASLFGAETAPLHIRHITQETYYRLLAPFLLPDRLQRILWLDSDLVVRGDLKEFYGQDLEGRSLIACRNMGESAVQSNAVRLGLPAGTLYFNAGVLLMNLAYLRAHGSQEQILSFCRKHQGLLKLQDQDVLNLLYHDSALVRTDQVWNCMVHYTESFVSRDIAERAVILHYAGKWKPWHWRWQDRYARSYWKIRREEGLRGAEYATLFFGRIWEALHGNDILTVVESPYFWLRARLVKSRW